LSRTPGRIRWAGGRDLGEHDTELHDEVAARKSVTTEAG
jgi:hypothetical protein